MQRTPIRTIDGFPLKKSISMMPDTFDPPINQWSFGKTLKLEVDDGLYRPVRREVQWKGQSMVVYDYELFVGIIQDWMKRDNMTKDQALDLAFEMV